MSLLSRYLNRCLLNLRYSRHTSSLAAASPEFNYRHHRGNSSSGRFVKSCGICSTLVGLYIFKDYLIEKFPSVDAKTISRREQFNFIADVVDIAAKSLVYIEIQDKGRIDYLTGQPATVSNGSGFIVESNGLILTNAHVVINKPRSNVLVKLNDGRTFLGNVEAVDPVSELFLFLIAY